MNTAIFFLCVTPSIDLIEFCKLINLRNFKAYIIVDNVYYNIQEAHKDFIIKIDNYECQLAGYIKSTCFTIHNLKCQAWEKVNYILCEKMTDIDFAWIAEEDVLIQSVESVINMTEKYKNYDLVAPGADINLEGKRNYWHWKRIPKDFPTPWQSSMVCAMGISRNLLNIVQKYVKENGRLLFIEFMYNTFCLHNNLKFMKVPEFSTITHRNKWTEEDFKSLPNNWFHPVKNRKIHSKILNLTDGTNFENKPMKSGCKVSFLM